MDADAAYETGKLLLLLLLMKVLLLEALPLLPKLLLLLLLKPVALGGDTRPANGCSRESTPCCKPLRTYSDASRAATTAWNACYHCSRPPLPVRAKSFTTWTLQMQAIAEPLHCWQRLWQRIWWCGETEPATDNR
jgi:hypothetical protein